MNYFTSDEADKLINAAKTDVNIFKTVQYNKYLEFVYKFDQLIFLTVPQWSKISSIAFFEGSYYITIAVFKSEFLYDIDTAINHGFINVKKDIDLNTLRNLKTSN